MPKVKHLRPHVVSDQLLPRLDETYQDPTGDLLRMAHLRGHLQEAPSGLLFMVVRYAEVARDMGMDTNDPDVMIQVVTGARAGWERDLAHERGRQGYRALEAIKRRAQAHPVVIYYMLIGGLVKIGLTTNIKKRYANLHPQTVLAIEPGGDDLERVRHAEFEHLHSHGEWFTFSEGLRSHIEELRVTFEQEMGITIDRWLGRLGIPADRTAYAGQRHVAQDQSGA